MLVDVLVIVHPPNFIVQIDQHERRASRTALDIFVQLLQQRHLHVKLFQFVLFDVFLVGHILTLLRKGKKKKELEKRGCREVLKK